MFYQWATISSRSIAEISLTFAWLADYATLQANTLTLRQVSLESLPYVFLALIVQAFKYSIRALLNYTFPTLAAFFLSFFLSFLLS
jgi:hypothetical protein